MRYTLGSDVCRASFTLLDAHEAVLIDALDMATERLCPTSHWRQVRTNFHALWSSTATSQGPHHDQWVNWRTVPRGFGVYVASLDGDLMRAPTPTRSINKSPTSSRGLSRCPQLPCVFGRLHCREEAGCVRLCCIAPWSPHDTVCLCHFNLRRESVCSLCFQGIPLATHSTTHTHRTLLVDPPTPALPLTETQQSQSVGWLLQLLGDEFVLPY